MIEKLLKYIENNETYIKKLDTLELIENGQVLKKKSESHSELLVKIVNIERKIVDWYKLQQPIFINKIDEYITK